MPLYEDMQDVIDSESMQEVFDRCEEVGMVLPWIVCFLSLNGSLLIMRVPGMGEPTDLLAKRDEDEGLRLPLTIIVIDQRNKAMRFAYELSGEKAQARARVVHYPDE